MKLKLIALAAVLAAAGSANAAIDNGSTGNGELFLNIWGSSGSYTLDLNTSIDAFTTAVAAPGSLDLSWAADATLTSFLAGVADTSLLKWNIMAADTSGARRLLTTFTTLPSTTMTNDVLRTADGNTGVFATAVNNVLGSASSVAVTSGSAAYAGGTGFKDTAGGYLNFSNAGTLANNSFASGLGFMIINGAATGIASSTYTPYVDGASAVNAWVDANNGLHIAAVTAVPEPENFAMLLAGLGLMGAITRRRRLGA